MKGFSVICFVAILFFGLASTDIAVASPGTRIYVSPPRMVDEAKGVGTTVAIDINIESDPGVDIQCNTYGFKLRWHGPLLQTSDFDVVDGGWFPEAYAEFGFTLFNGPDPVGVCDYVVVANILLMPEPPYDKGVNGSGTLATVTFTVESIGETALLLYETTLLNIYGASIEHTIENGYFSNESWASRGYPGDANGDHAVDISDLQIVFKAMGTNPSWPHGTGWGQWNPVADLNDDNKVDIFDLHLVGINYGQPLD